MICPNCGKRLTKSESFCNFCGERLPTKKGTKSKHRSSEAKAVVGDSDRSNGHQKTGITGIIRSRSFIVILIILVAFAISVTVVVVFINMKGSQGTEVSEEQFQEQQAMEKRAAQMFEEASKETSTEEAARKTADWLKKQEGVVDAGIGDGCIWGTYEDGTEFTIITSNPFLEK